LEAVEFGAVRQGYPHIGQCETVAHIVWHSYDPSHNVVRILANHRLSAAPECPAPAPCELAMAQPNFRNSDQAE
jgi:hypothetical protein